MLTMPNAMAKMGLIPAIPLAIFIACMSLWSMKMLICLYVARRSILVRCCLSAPLCSSSGSAAIRCGAAFVEPLSSAKDLSCVAPLCSKAVARGFCLLGRAARGQLQAVWHLQATCCRREHSPCRAPCNVIVEDKSSALIGGLSLQIVQKQWIGEDGVRSVTQYHDVMGAILGKFAKGIVMVRFCQRYSSEYSIAWDQLLRCLLGDLLRQA